MPGPFQWKGSNGLLSGLFGVLQTAATDRLSTADVWSSLRTAAGTWQWQAQGGGELPPQSELEAAGRGILSQAGIGIQQVNQYRGIAGAWRGAKDRLQSALGGDQITARHIFTPPWATTGGDEQDSRYRLRVQWEITPTSGEPFTKWHSYELTNPLTSIGDALAQAGDKIAGDKYLSLLAGDSSPTIADYQIEMI